MSITGADSVTVQGKKTQSSNVSITSTDAVTVSAVKNASNSVSITEVSSVTATAARSKSVSVSISESASVTLSTNFEKRSSVLINVVGIVSREVVKGQSVDIIGQGSVEVAVPSFRPVAPTTVRAVRSGSTVTLTWQDGLETYQVQVLRSNGQRASQTVVATVNAGVQTYTDTPAADVVASYQLVPLGITNKKGRASQIVYSATPSNIL